MWKAAAFGLSAAASPEKNVPKSTKKDLTTVQRDRIRANKERAMAKLAEKRLGKNATSIPSASTSTLPTFPGATQSTDTPSKVLIGIVNAF